MFRAILPDGNVLGERFEHTDTGVEIYTEDDDFKAFIPYQNLIALMNEDIIDADDPSIR